MIDGSVSCSTVSVLAAVQSWHFHELFETLFKDFYAVSFPMTVLVMWSMNVSPILSITLIPYSETPTIEVISPHPMVLLDSLSNGPELTVYSSRLNYVPKPSERADWTQSNYSYYCLRRDILWCSPKARRILQTLSDFVNAISIILRQLG